MRLRVYLDTSVFSAYFDARTPDRRVATREFWDRASAFELTTSEVAQHELSQVDDPARRRELVGLLDGVIVHLVTQEMTQLARAYSSAGLFGETSEEDALHVAAAVVTGCHILVSWNYRHLVNRRRRAGVNEVNIAGGLPTIEIVSPPEA